MFKLKKFQGKHIDWKPVLFELFGFKSNSIIEKYQKDDERSNKKSGLIKDISSEFKVSAEDIDKIKGIIDIKEHKKAQSLWIWTKS